MRTDIVCKALVRNQSGLCLVLRRSETDSRRPLQWDLPGGLVEAGEDFAAAVVREVYEESGLRVEKPQLVYAMTEHRTWDKDQANVVRLFFVADANSETVTLSFEHDDSTWVALNKALQIISYDKHQEFLRYVKQWGL